MSLLWNIYRPMVKLQRTLCDVVKLASSNHPLSIENELKIHEVLKPIQSDISHIATYLPNTFNLASYVNVSDTLKKLVDLGVDLNKIEKKPHLAEKLLLLDFEKDIKNHIFFISTYVDPEKIGYFITKNPGILHESLDDMQVRINYMLSKKFEETQMKRIFTKNPFWLSYSTTRIDRRLGFFQEHFRLNGPQVRSLATTQPKLITYNLQSVKDNTFVIKEEMGFNDQEISKLILKKPKLWIINQLSLKRRFDYIHNEMKIPHHIIFNNPQILESRTFRIKQRHLFLQSLGRDQYDPKKENYVPITALVELTDSIFCELYAKCNVCDFNMFLKTL